VDKIAHKSRNPATLEAWVIKQAGLLLSAQWSPKQNTGKLPLAMLAVKTCVSLQGSGQQALEAP